MNNKMLVGFTALVLGVVSVAAEAGPGRGKGHDRHGGHDYARVVRVEPIMERVRYTVPVQQCWTEERVRGGGGDRTGAAIVGGAVGAIVGNQIGNGDTRRVATVGGALVGAALGSELARGDRSHRYETVEHCRTRHEARYDERVAAYRVTYLYNGRRETTRLSYDPGRYLKVAVDVRPLG